MDGETRKTEFRSHSGEKLAAALELPRGMPRAYALFAHCFSCSKDIKAAREIARALRLQGFAVLRFDFTGLGGSEGDFANTNFSSNIEDLISAADYLRREFEAPSIVIGHSLGGAATLVAAGKIAEVKGVAVIAAPAEATHVLAQIKDARDEIEEKGVAEVQLAGRPFMIKKQFIDDLEQSCVKKAAAALKKPLLILHSPIDQTVGVENATEIFVSAKHPKSFVSLDGADHLLSNADDARYAAQIIAVWAGRYIGETGALSEDAKTTTLAPHFKGGALAQSIAAEPLAIALSVDGHPRIIDASKDEGGSDLGPNPTRTVEGALAACGAMTMKMYARRKGWDLESVNIRVSRAKSEDPHAPQALEKEVKVAGSLDDAQRARLLEIADKCPVHRMLTEGVKVRSGIA